MKQTFRFRSGCIEGQPTFVIRMCDTFAINSEVSQPFLDHVDCLLDRSKRLNDFLRSPMFCIIVGLGMRTITVSVMNKM